jgi:thioredoxin 2
LTAATVRFEGLYEIHAVPVYRNGQVNNLSYREKLVIAKCGQCGAKNRIDPAAARQRRPVCGKCGFLLDLPGEVAEDNGKPLVVTDASFPSDVVEASKRLPVLVDCWAEWCGPCRVIAPTLDEIAAESAGRYRIAKLNVDENPSTSASFQIRSIPTLLIFSHGKLVDRIVGLQPKPAIAAKLAQFG